MSLDERLVQYALRNKHLVVLDTSFPKPAFPDFKRNFDLRYVWIPCRESVALGMAAGLAASKKLVVVYGLSNPTADLPDSTLNVKVLAHSSVAKWHEFEPQLAQFGPAVLLIPPSESSSLGAN